MWAELSWGRRTGNSLRNAFAIESQLGMPTASVCVCVWECESVCKWPSKECVCVCALLYADLDFTDCSDISRNRVWSSWDCCRMQATSSSPSSSLPSSSLPSWGTKVHIINSKCHESVWKIIHTPAAMALFSLSFSPSPSLSLSSSLYLPLPLSPFLFTLPSPDLFLALCSLASFARAAQRETASTESLPPKRCVCHGNNNNNNNNTKNCCLLCKPSLEFSVTLSYKCVCLLTWYSITDKQRKHYREYIVLYIFI